LIQRKPLRIQATGRDEAIPLYYSVSADFAPNSVVSMRYRLPPPIRPFDLTPVHLVETAKRIFTLWWARKPPTTLDQSELCSNDFCRPELVSSLGDS
jgi:hypothetical protein